MEEEGTPRRSSSRPRSIRRLVVDTVSRFQSNRCPLMAAGLAYYLLISTSPVLVVAIAVAGSILGREEAERALLERVDELLGGSAAEAVQGLVRDPALLSGGLAASLIAVAILLYGSTRAFAALQSSLDLIWETPPSASVRLGVLQLLRARLLAVVLVMASGLVVVAGMALETLGSTVTGAIASHLPSGLSLGALGYRAGLVLLRACCLAAVYRLLPWHGPSWRAAWPGALLAALLLGLGHSLIGWYVAHGHLRSAYGAAGSVIALLFSFYFVAYIALLGAQFSKVYAQSRA